MEREAQMCDRAGLGRREQGLGPVRVCGRYVHPAARGRGIASALLKALIDSAEQAGIWTIQSGIFPENAASLTLRQRHGFRIIGTRQRIGTASGATSFSSNAAAVRWCGSGITRPLPYPRAQSFTLTVPSSRARFHPSL
ncbi:hypothetical protein GCM10020367_71030 [Streptomyces sannanensis]|uniref:N-acetyltransferase domain-containing protein n=1 Tax=Streptomyces sannanensis TaxID=285536 RepID=A0ABP6SNU6_9ACTN